MIISDFHVHTEFSGDSTAPMEEMVDQAIHLGFKKLCFTDHMDYDYPYERECPFTFDCNEYFRRIGRLKEIYQSKIELLIGIELGLQPHLNEQLDSLIKNYPFDFVIGSSHVVDNIDPYFSEYWEDKSVEKGIERYFESILENCISYNGFHVYGHIDYIERYVPGRKDRTDFNDVFTYQKYKDIIDEILKKLLSIGKGIEVNTAGYKYGLNHPHPKAEILKRYRELGGELITIGSDAHKPEHLGYDFNQAASLLESLGFRYYAVFKNGKPEYMKLN